jgi:Flp pilus assembly protein TadD
VARSKRNSGKTGTPRPPLSRAGEVAGRRKPWWASRTTVLTGVLLAAGVVLLLGLSHLLIDDAPLLGLSQELPAATFVGSETCAGCHRAEAELWQRSQHKHAMAHASEKSVLGDFADTTFDYHNVRSRFFRKDGKFFVETDGADGKLATFEIKYTFGIDPLQQYLIEFPNGRLQALSIAWDCRPKEKGGQRWFHLYPNENIEHDDVLHWTKLNQNWNFMCAECHSTGVRKNYDVTHDSFATTWSELSVGCEACHGEGSRHVAWAHERKTWRPFAKHDDASEGLAVRFDERRDATWLQDPTRASPQRSVPPTLLRKEVETCGRCHARRSAFSEQWAPGTWLSNTHRVAPLDRRLFHADGQMRDDEETYNYAPFKQSKMFAMGVTCSDCHDPHSAALRAPGDGACAQCHAPNKYATASHRHHAGVDPPLGCASCHMPERTYMVIDRRHDHSFRIPRPDLSVTLGTPNACNDCHQDRSAQWAAETIDSWFGRQRHGFQTYAQALKASWNDQPDAESQLLAVAAARDTPDYVRAGALADLRLHASQAEMQLARSGLADPDPMVRIGALDMLEGLPLQQRWPLASPLLSDSVRGVRLRAASLLASVPIAQLPASERARFENAAAEFVAAQRLNADRPEARTTLATFYTQRGLLAEAEVEYHAALRLSPQYAPAYVNLADLYRQMGRDGDAEGMLRSAAGLLSSDAGIHHALGLALVRLKRLDEALVELRRATQLAPDQPRYSYVYGVALHSVGSKSEGLAVLKESLARHPSDRDVLRALVSFSRENGDAAAALEYAQQLARITPSDPSMARLIKDLQRQIKEPAAR